MHESNHFACQEARLLTFTHLLNKVKINSIHRIFMKACSFIDKIRNYLSVSSEILADVRKVLRSMYDVDSVFDNDLCAIFSGIEYVQNHESQMRGPLEV